MYAVVYAWICRELIARIQSPKYLDRWFRENPGGLSNKSLLHCTAGPPSTRTGTLLDLGIAQSSRVCPQRKDVRREGTSACVSLALLWGCISGLGITKSCWICQFGWVLRPLLQDKVFFTSKGLHCSPPFTNVLGYFGNPLHPDFQPCSSLVPYMATLGLRPVLILFLVLKIRNSAWWKSWEFFRQFIACHLLSK